MAEAGDTTRWILSGLMRFVGCFPTTKKMGMEEVQDVGQAVVGVKTAGLPHNGLTSGRVASP